MEYCVREVGWRDFLSDSAVLGNLGGSIFRIESSGENFEVERELLCRGYPSALEEDETREEFLSPDQLRALIFENGRILPSRQWYLGWKEVLETLEDLIRESGSCQVMNAPGEIIRLFDKAECHRMLSAKGVKTPELISQPWEFDELVEDMRSVQASRVFLKPCHSSSASGIVALEFGKDGVQAFTTLEREGGVLYNSLRIHRHTRLQDIRGLVDAICRHRCLAERWLPKAGFQGKRLDLRMLVVAGRAAQAVLRQSTGPMTNLHLGNQRGDIEAFRERLGERAWREVCATCEAAAAVFPRALYVGVDLLISPSLRKFAVAEVNAFGDLLPRLKYEGLSTYELELRRLEDSLSCRKVGEPCA
jgi:glutathione synthase/RimK-type ligase-like ATP-grasp enzyme